MSIIARTRIFRIRLPFFGLLGFVYLALALLIGYWAGRVARDRGRDFAQFMIIGVVTSLCGLIPGLIVVVVAYSLAPKAGAPAPGATAPPASGPPPSYKVPAPPPPPAPTTSDERERGQATQRPDGSFEYTPPPPKPPPRS